MALLDAAYILSAVRKVLAEYSSVKWTDDQLNKWVQEAAMDISIKSLGYEVIDSIATAVNTLEYSEPSGCIKIHACAKYDDPCLGATDLTYDGDNPSTIARDASAEITISDGLGPFTWAVSGTGFTLDDAITTGRTNTLRADGSACGTATITITDACSDSDTGYVRCTTGQWVQKSDDVCTLSGSGTLIAGGGTRSPQYELVSGYQKQWQTSYCPVNIGTGSEVCATYYWYFGMTLAEYCSLQRDNFCTFTPRCTNCIDSDNDFCTCNGAGTPRRTWCVGDLKYYEWEC